MHRLDFNMSNCRDVRPLQSHNFSDRTGHFRTPANQSFNGDPTTSSWNRFPTGMHQQMQQYHSGVVGGNMMGHQHFPRTQSSHNTYMGARMVSSYMMRGGGFSRTGYGSVGDNNGLAGGRYQPYPNPNQAPYIQQPQKAGFLEQLLKNRAIPTHTYQPYGRPPHIRGNITHAHPPYLTQQQSFGYHNASSNQNTAFGRAYMPVPNFDHAWNRPGDGPNHGNMNHGNTLQFQNPFHQRQYVRNNMPVIRSDPDDNSSEELAHEEIMKSGARFRRNHERMIAILDEKLVNCDPPTVSLDRISSLQQYVKLLQDDVKKHKKETVLVKEHCKRSLEEFDASTSKFNADYQKLCEPVGEIVYNELVDKFYKEIKNAVQENEDGQDFVGLHDANHNDLLSVTKQIDSCCNEKGLADISVNYNSNLELANRTIDMRENYHMPNEELYFDHTVFEDPLPDNMSLSQNPQLPDSSMGMLPIPPSHSGPNYGPVSQPIDQPYFPPDLVNEERHGPRTRSYYRAQGQNIGNQQVSQRWQDNFSNAFPQENQYDGSCRQGSTMRRLRPTDELREFLMGLVGNYKDESYSLPNQPNMSPQLQQQPEDISQPCASEDSGTQRRFLNSGGVVEVRSSSPPPPPSEPIFDVTRDWINSLSCTTGDGPEIPDDHADRVLPVGFENENLLDDFGSSMEEQVVSNTPNVDLESGNGCSGKDSKLAEILESPCLNDSSSGEFESQMKQLEDALNENDVSNRELDAMDVSDDNDQEVAAICQNQSD